MPSDRPIEGRCGVKLRGDRGYCANKPHDLRSKTNKRCKFHGGMSTGPRTAEGKARVSMNAFKHGLYSEKLRDTFSPSERKVFDDVPPTTDLGEEIRLARMNVYRFQKMLADGREYIISESKAASVSEKGHSFSEAAVNVRDLLDRALRTLAALAKAQQEMHPGASVGGNLRVVISLTAEARAVAAKLDAMEGAGDVPDLTDGTPEPIEPDEPAESAPIEPKPRDKFEGLT